ncbi:MAG TPA: hypothetical protein VNC16_10700 [Solirubrobacterales bacterium]|nr:hypothetical protein [Solirubrobacterales bacterium]
MPPAKDPSPAAIDGNSGQVASFYLGNHHKLIHRHTESMAIRADQTARWTLRIDFELPRAPQAGCGEHNGERIFLFPLLFLRKAQGRTGFEARDEQGATVPLLNRKLSDEISGRAAAVAATRLVEAGRIENPDLPDLPSESLEFVFERVCKWRPYIASVILSKLKHNLDKGIRKVWREEGLIEDLELLVDHSLVWVPLRGLPGERRVIEVGHDTELSRRPLLRWHFGELKLPRNRLRWWRRRHRRRQLADEEQVLDTGEAKYGQTARRASLSVLGERLAQPLGWMPIEFDFPTIYTRRCDSYHFEMTCPGGLKPRGVRVTIDEEGGKNGKGEREERESPATDEGQPPAQSDEKKAKEERKDLERSARKTMGSRAAHLYLPGGRDVGDVVLRATVGISSDAFPILWVLMGTITTVMLWALVALNPNWLVGDGKSHNEIAAGVLLIVPALLGALIVGSDEKAESKLLSGARILLLVTGLCCAGATAVLTDIKPFSTKPQATWAVCAAVATAALIPLVTSWLLSLDAVWRAREALNSVTRQYLALFGLAALALGLVVLLPHTGGDTIFRAALASCLLLLSVLMILLASNRLAVSLEANRKFLSVAAMTLAALCLVLGCVELQKISAPDANWQKDAEDLARAILPVAFFSGLALWGITRIFGPRRGELSIAPSVGQALIAEERIRELRRLREINANPEATWRRVISGAKRLRPTSGQESEEIGVQSKVKVEPAGKTEGDWVIANSSSTELPEYREEEFPKLVQSKEESPGVEIEIKAEEVEESDIKAIAEREGMTELEVELALLKHHVQMLEAGGNPRFRDRVKARVSRFRGR